MTIADGQKFLNALAGHVWYDETLELAISWKDVEEVLKELMDKEES